MSFIIKYYGGKIMPITMGQMRNGYRTLIENQKERGHLEDSWEYMIKMDCKVAVCDKVDLRYSSMKL
jgi:hypothetical protein